jgi:hypothetical protein
MARNSLAQAVKEAAAKRRGRETLTCAEALELADRFHSSPKRVRYLCDKTGIKIIRCKLGCFT